jgi:hypothetical protein
MAKPRNVTIIPSDNGGLAVEIGCKCIVFTCPAIAFQELQRYYDDPEGVEKEYAERHKWYDGSPTPPPLATAGYEEPERYQVPGHTAGRAQMAGMAAEAIGHPGR